MTEKLKPCPFCGCTNIWHEEGQDVSCVQCASCGIGTGWVPGHLATSINRWNRRADDDAD